MKRIRNEWQARHYDALLLPSEEERPLVELLRLCDELSTKFATDGVIDSAVARLILGTRELLVTTMVGRLDPGTLDAELVKYAERIDFDLDTEVFGNGERL